MTSELPRRSQPLRQHDASQILQRLIQAVVDDRIIVLTHVPDLFPGCGQAPADRFGAVLGSLPQTHFQHFQ